MSAETEDLEPSLASDPVDAPAPQIKSKGDRRRPGRREVHPALVPLVRSPAAGSLPEAEALPAHPGDDLAPVRGIAVALLLAIPLWAGIFLLGRLVWKLIF